MHEGAATAALFGGSSKWTCSTAVAQVLDSLRKTRSAYSRSRAPYGEASWGKRLNQLSAGVVTAARTVLSFVLSVPGRIRGFIALSSEERRKVYAGWWGVVKKEARHYWVGPKGQSHP